MDFICLISAFFIVSISTISGKPTDAENGFYIFKKQCETKCIGNGVSCRPISQGPYKWECSDGRGIVKGAKYIATTKRQNLRTGTGPDPEGNVHVKVVRAADCYDCDLEEGWVCPEKKRTWIQDKSVPNPYPNRAFFTIPDGFAIKKSNIPGAGFGVWTLRNISECVVIGPYGGVRIYNKKESTLDYAWKISDIEDDLRYLVDAADPARSNWLRYINCALKEEEQNLDAVQYKGEMYYQVTKAIPAGTEILVWYGDGYARYLGLI